MFIHGIHVPQQESKRDSCLDVSDGTRLAEVLDKSRGLNVIGYVHTHPEFDKRPSSVDIHQFARLKSHLATYT